jgi:hypothetical protein
MSERVGNDTDYYVVGLAASAAARFIPCTLRRSSASAKARRIGSTSSG